MTKYHKYLIVAMTAYFILIGGVSLLRHYNFQTQTWDLAVFVQVMWNTLDGRIMINNLEDVPNTLGVHFSPILFLLVPFYALWKSPYALLIIQSLALALGAWPLFELSKKILKDANWALIISIAYLLYPALHWSNIYDFHPVTFLVPLLLTAFYYLEIERWLLSTLLFTLASATREDSILVVAFAGLFILARGVLSKHKNYKIFGATLFAGGMIYFLLTVKLLMPLMGGGLLRFDRYAHLGSDAGEVALNIFRKPEKFAQAIFNWEKVGYVFWLFLPLAFAPLLILKNIFLIAPGLIENVLTDYGFQFSGLYHYDSVLIGGIFVATIFGIKRALDRWPKSQDLIKKVFLIAVFMGFILRSPINPFSFPYEFLKSNEHWKMLREIIKIVPLGASVTAYTNLVPHLSNREHAYMLGREPFMTDYVLIDGGDYFGFKTPSDFENYVDSYMKTGNYDMRVIKDRYFIMIRKI